MGNARPSLDARGANVANVPRRHQAPSAPNGPTRCPAAKPRTIRKGRGAGCTLGWSPHRRRQGLEPMPNLTGPSRPRAVVPARFAGTHFKNGGFARTKYFQLGPSTHAHRAVAFPHNNSAGPSFGSLPGFLGSIAAFSPSRPKDPAAFSGQGVPCGPHQPPQTQRQDICHQNQPAALEAAHRALRTSRALRPSWPTAS